MQGRRSSDAGRDSQGAFGGRAPQGLARRRLQGKSCTASKPWETLVFTESSFQGFLGAGFPPTSHAGIHGGPPVREVQKDHHLQALISKPGGAFSYKCLLQRVFLYPVGGGVNSKETTRFWLSAVWRQTQIYPSSVLIICHAHGATPQTAAFEFCSLFSQPKRYSLNATQWPHPDRCTRTCAGGWRARGEVIRVATSARGPSA